MGEQGSRIQRVKGSSVFSPTILSMISSNPRLSSGLINSYAFHSNPLTLDPLNPFKIINRCGDVPKNFTKIPAFKLDRLNDIIIRGHPKISVLVKIEEYENLTHRNTNNGFSFHEKTFRPHVSPTSRDYYVFRGLTPLQAKPKWQLKIQV